MLYLNDVNDDVEVFHCTIKGGDCLSYSMLKEE